MGIHSNRRGLLRVVQAGDILFGCKCAECSLCHQGLQNGLGYRLPGCVSWFRFKEESDAVPFMAHISDEGETIGTSVAHSASGQSCGFGLKAVGSFTGGNRFAGTAHNTNLAAEAGTSQRGCVKI